MFFRVFLCLFPSGDSPRADCREAARRWASRCVFIYNMLFLIHEKMKLLLDCSIHYNILLDKLDMLTT